MSAVPRVCGVLASVFLAGCGTRVGLVDHYDVPAADLRAYQDLEIAPAYSQDNPLYENLGLISGLSCNRSGTQTADERDAIDQLKLKARLMGADAMTDPGCAASSGIDWANNCYTSVLCEAIALKKLADPD